MLNIQETSLNFRVNSEIDPRRREMFCISHNMK